MRLLLQEIPHAPPLDAVAARLSRTPGLVWLRSGGEPTAQSRYSLLAARPFLTVRTRGTRCELHAGTSRRTQFGNPWPLLDHLLSRYEMLDELDLPFPAGGCFGYWGYDLKNFSEPRLPRRAVDDLELPDAYLGFYDSLVVFDRELGKTWIIATGLRVDGSRSQAAAQAAVDFWRAQLDLAAKEPHAENRSLPAEAHAVASNFTRENFLAATRRALQYIRAGDIYQVNLSQRFAVPWAQSGWALFDALCRHSAAPFAAYLNCDGLEIASASPERFFRLSGAHAQTRPIKGTRPRGHDADADARLAHELQTSAKENAELVMITDLLRNDLGRICEFGSVMVPELARLERFPQVQHLVSTVEGRLKAGTTHLTALRECFPGGSITGAPKIRAIEIIDELEPVTRGPYTGCIGYLGFNRESQLSIAIRTALAHEGTARFQTGAGIVADSDPEAEYEETLAKAGGFFAAVQPARAAWPQPFFP